MPDKPNVHSGHRQRLRDQALTDGLNAFYPHQVLELLLFYILPRRDVNDLAHALIDAFGSVQGVLSADRETLLGVKGVGGKTADWLLSIGSLVAAYGKLNVDDKPRIANYRSTFDFLLKRQDRVSPPQCYQLCASPSGVILSYTKLCDSRHWAEPQTLKKALSDALAVHARSIILIEFIGNLPLTAGQYDLKHAAEFANTLRVMNAELIDIVLVSTDGVLSLSQSGQFDRTASGASRSSLSERYLRETDAIHADDALPASDFDL